MNDMKILTLDIETAPNLVYTWGLWNQNIGIDFIVEPTYIMCWSAKWLHKKKVITRSYDDPDFLQLIWDLIDEADAVVTYNGISFDLKHLNREFAEAGYTPPTPPANIDLLRTVKKQFRFPSNKMDYVADRLIGERKQETGGMKLWLDCMNGVKAAWKKMRDYNRADVVITERLYEHLRGWIVGHPNHGLYVEDQESPICRNCGSDNLHRKGWQRTNVRGYQRYKCQDCGANLRGRHMVKGGKNSPQVLS